MPDDLAVSGTRADLLRAARRLFAERGFYGASIAAIAEELGLTKQALLHHFGSKEKLYGEVLAQMASRLTGQVAGGGEADAPAARLEAFVAALFDSLFARPEETQLLLRELLDNRARAGHAHTWHMKGFLDALTALARQAPGGRALSEREALTRLYLIIGAMTYFAVSEPTLRQMYENVAFETLKAQAREEAVRMARDAFG